MSGSVAPSVLWLHCHHQYLFSIVISTKTCLAAIMVAAAIAITACESFDSLSDELQSGGNATLSAQY